MQKQNEVHEIDYDDHVEQTQNISSWKDAANRLIASALASSVAETTTLPTDVIKTRLQIQNFTTKLTTGSPNIASQRMYNGMADAAVSIYTHEGAAGLFRGLQPALIRQVSYTGLALVVFEPVRDTIALLSSSFSSNTEHGDGTPGFLTRVVSGGVAGSLGIAVMNPTEVLKTKMQANQSSLYESPTMFGVMRNVYRTDGIRGFWSGVKPNICRAFLVNAAELGMYDNAKHWISVEYAWCSPSSILGHVFASFIAGTSSALISTPVDVVKTRFMNQAGSGHKQYNTGMIRTLISIPKNEGFFALYKGFTPIICRKVIWCTIFFVSYERVRAHFGLPPKK